MTYQGSKLGENYLAVNALLIQLIMLASFFLDAYAFSTEGIVGYSLGKKDLKHFVFDDFKFYNKPYIFGLYYFFNLFMFKKIIDELTNIDYLKFLTSNYIFWILVMPLISSFCYQFDGIFIGASQTAEMRNAMILSSIIFISSSNFLVSKFGNHGLWLALLFFMIIRSLTLNYYFNRILKKF